MKKYISGFLVILGIFFLHAQTTKKALFIGNSYIYTNNLPQLIAQMANSTGDQLVHDSNTPGGYTLKQHSTNATTLSKINQGNWDFVILQDQSQYPSFPDNFVQNNVYPYAEALNLAIIAANPCTETVFYATWGRKNGDQENCPGWPPVCTYEGMDDLLQQRYRYMADTNDAVLSPVSWVWRYIRTHHPEIELYSSDNSHPSLVGSYAAAAAFYTVMFEKNPEEISFNSSLSVETANKIRAAVKTIVWENLNTWNVGKYNPQADFTYLTLENPLRIQFQNTSQFATEYFWDFGDGTTSTEENPEHTYMQPGNFTVKLKVQNCGLEDEIHIELDLNLNLNETDSHTQISIFPNPVKDILQIQNLKESSKIQLYNTNGQLLFETSSNQIDTKNLSEGIYILKILEFSTKNTQTIKFIKN